MSELALDDRDRDPFHHQFEGVGVSKTVGVHSLQNASPDAELLDEAAHIRARYSVPAARAEQWLVGSESSAGPFRQPLLDNLKSRRIDSNSASTISLAMQDAYRGAEEVNILGLESKGLATSQTGTVENDEQGAIPQLGVRVGGTCFEQRAGSRSVSAPPADTGAPCSPGFDLPRVSGP